MAAFFAMSSLWKRRSAAAFGDGETSAPTFESLAVFLPVTMITVYGVPSTHFQSMEVSPSRTVFFPLWWFF